MLLKLLFKILVFTFTGLNFNVAKVSEGPDAVGTKISPGKLLPRIKKELIKKDSVSQTQSPFVIFKMINADHQATPKAAGSLKNAGKMARTSGNHLFTGKI